MLDWLFFFYHELENSKEMLIIAHFRSVLYFLVLVNKGPVIICQFSHQNQYHDIQYFLFFSFSFFHILFFNLLQKQSPITLRVARGFDVLSTSLLHVCLFSKFCFLFVVFLALDLLEVPFCSLLCRFRLSHSSFVCLLKI
jgi:hypothetical protein